MESRTFATIFDCIDRVTAPLQNILDMRAKLSQNSKITVTTEHIDKFKVDGSAATKSIDTTSKQMQNIMSGRKITFGSDTSGIMSLDKSIKTNQTFQSGLLTTTDQVKAFKESFAEVDQKGSNALGSLKNKFGELSNAAGSFQTAIAAIAGIALTGAIGGITWEAADQSQKFLSSAMVAMKNKKIDTAKAMASVNAMADTGLVTKTDQVKLISTLAARGMKGDVAIQSAEQVTRGYSTNSAYMKEMYGLSSAQDAIELLTRPVAKGTDPRSQLMRNQINDVARQMGYTGTKDFAKMSVTQREKALKNFQLYQTDENGNPILDEKGNKQKLTDADIEKRNAPQILQNRMSNLGKEIGKTMIGPMEVILGFFEKFILLVQSIPGAPGLLAIGAGLIGLLSVLTLVGPLMGTASAVIGTLSSASAAAAVKTGLLAGAQVTQAGAASVGVVANSAAGVSAGAASKGFWAMASGIWASIAPLLIIIVPLLLLIGVLYLIETKTHIFSRALKELGRTQMAADLFNWFRDCGWQIQQAIKFIDAFYKAMNLKTGHATKFILDLMGGTLSFLGEKGNELLEFISNLIKRILSFLDWIYSLWTSFWSWLRDAIPGAKKEKAREPFQKELDTIAKQNGLTSLTYLGNGQYQGMDKSGGTKQYNLSNDPNQSGSGLSILNLFKGTPAQQLAHKDKLENLQTKYDTTPGMWDDLTKAITDLTNAILGAGKDLVQKNIVEPVQTPVKKVQDTANKAFEDYVPGYRYLEGKKDEIFGAAHDFIFGSSKKSDTGAPEYVRGSVKKSWDEVYQASKDSGLSDKDATANADNQKSLGLTYAVGAQFTKSGLFQGTIHKDEEITSLATAKRGPGVLSRAIEDLGEAQRSGTGGGGRRQTVNNFNTYQVTASMPIGNVSTEVDLAKIDRAMRASMDDIFNRKVRQMGN